MAAIKEDLPTSMTMAAFMGVSVSSSRMFFFLKFGFLMGCGISSSLARNPASGHSFWLFLGPYNMGSMEITDFIFMP